VVLQPWGQLRGRLVKNGKGIADENVDLTWSFTWAPDRRPHLLICRGLERMTKDGSPWKHVPPVKLHLTTRISIGAERGWTQHIQRRFTIGPGEDLDLETWTFHCRWKETAEKGIAEVRTSQVKTNGKNRLGQSRVRGLMQATSDFQNPTIPHHRQLTNRPRAGSNVQMRVISIHFYGTMPG
jgi:hypothetical protein